jgi:hypothetical protein
MSKVQFTVAEIKLPAAGKERGNIITSDGRKYGCFREKFGLFQVGSSYDADISDGQYQNIVSAKLLAAASPPAQQQPAPAPQTNGNGHANGSYPQAAAFRTPEQMFVSGVLTAYINSGRCEPEKLTQTINYIRVAWNRTFGGNDGTFLASEAGQRHHLQAAE